MERLVYELKKFNFQQCLNSQFTENCNSDIVPKIEFKFMNMDRNCGETFTEKKLKIPASEENENSSDDASVSTDSDSLDDNANDEDDTDADNVGAAEASNKNESLYKSYGERPTRSRTMQQRKTRQSLRTPMKPSRPNAKNTTNLDSLKIKFYLNRKLTKFRPASLETIFEEPQPVKGSEQYRFIGGRKVRRTLNCSDGFNINKSLTKKRREKVKKVFGKRILWNKIPLESFMEHMQTNVHIRGSDNETDINNSSAKSESGITLKPHIVLSSLDAMDVDAGNSSKTESELNENKGYVEPEKKTGVTNDKDKEL